MGWLRRLMRVLLALAVLGALSPAAPALAMPVEQGAASPASSSDAAPSCDASNMVCVGICQPAFPAPVDYAQAPVFPGDVVAVGEWTRVSPRATRAVPVIVSLAQPGPPPYLLFRRLLL